MRIALFALIAAAGCASLSDSKLEQGGSVEVGRRPFDTYFEEIAALRDDVSGIDSDLFPMREPLVEELDVSVDAPIGSLMEATNARVTKIRDFGIMLSLRLTPTPKILMVKGQVEVDDRDQPLFDAIEKSATIAMAEFRKHTVLLEKTARLETRRGELAEQLAKLPPRVDEQKREIIEAEILGAGRILRKAESDLLRNTRTISHYLVALSNAVDTGATENLETKCDEAIAAAAEDKKPKQPRSQPKPRWRPPPGPRPAAPRPPPKPAPGGGDFEM